MPKSTVAQIRERFDNDVDRFSNLETGQSATIDSPLVLDLITDVAAAVTPNATSVLDIGCGAGNYTLKMLQRRPALACTLIDLSAPMLARARERVTAAGASSITTLQGDVRELDLGENRFDLILAASVLHHLRADDEWESVFTKLHRSLRPGGSFWISDLIEHSGAPIQTAMWRRYGEYLSSFKGENYRDQVFAYIDQEDTPRPLMYQLDLLGKVGFVNVDVLHKNSCFAAFGGMKG